jgi:transcriptional regulator with XRE-family HTH domain
MANASTVLVDGQEIRRRRLDLRLTQTELARRAGVDQGWLSKVERGRVPQISVRFLRALETQIGQLERLRPADVGIATTVSAAK